MSLRGTGEEGGKEDIVSITMLGNASRRAFAANIRYRGRRADEQRGKRGRGAAPSRGGATTLLSLAAPPGPSILTSINGRTYA